MVRRIALARLGLPPGSLESRTYLRNTGPRTPAWQLGLPPGQILSSKAESAEPAQATAHYTISLPPGWIVTITSISHQDFEQGVRVEYNQRGRRIVKMLTNIAGKHMGNMYNSDDGAGSIDIEQVEEETEILLKFHASHKTEDSGDEQSGGGVMGGFISTEEVEISCGVIFTINVHKEPGSTILDQVTTVVYTAADPLNLGNIQGDIIFGLPKVVEHFYYFRITDVSKFKRIFKDQILPNITTTAQLLSKPSSAQPDPDDPFIGLNIALSSIGLKLFGLDPAEIGDHAFLRGQMADARMLGDTGEARGDAWSPDWDLEFKANIHGIFLITAFNGATAKTFIEELEEVFTWAPRRSCITKVANIPTGPRIAHQVAQDSPAAEELQVLGREGDAGASIRPEWVKDGSLMVTRKFRYLVPDFEKHLVGKDGAKLVSSAYARRFLLRNGMPYGLSEAFNPEHEYGTIEDRGLHFCTYHRSIQCEFRSIQRGYFGEPLEDQITRLTTLGSSAVQATEAATDINIDSTFDDVCITALRGFLEACGGEYFFSPSMSCLLNYIAE